MADIKISQLASEIHLSAADVTPIVSNGVTKKTTMQAIKDFTIGTEDNSELGADVSTQISTLNQTVEGKADADDVSSEIQTLTNKLNDEVKTRSILGAKNMFAGKFSSEVVSGVTLLIQENGTGLLSSTGDTENANFTSTAFTLKKGSYRLGKNVTAVSGTRIAILVNNSVYQGIIGYDEWIPFTIESDITCTIRLYVAAHTGAMTDIKFEPSIILASDPSTEYTEYAMTNRELTEKLNVEDLSSQVTLTENCFSCSLVRQANICHINVAAKSGVNGFTSIATVPTALKPKYNTPMACFAVTGADSPKIEDAVLNTNGLISIRTTSATSDIAYLSCTWIV